MFFWLGPWLGETPLQLRFPRLFELSQNKWETVAGMFSLGWGREMRLGSGEEGCGRWEEELLVEFRGLLHDITLQVNVGDKWLWHSDQVTGYSVCGAYQFLCSSYQQFNNYASELLWENEAPVKVSLLACRLFRNRLPTKYNLFSRGIIPQDSQLCVGGCGDRKSVV